MKKIWQPKRFPRKCKEFGVDLCYVCSNFANLKMKCAIIYYKDSLAQAEDPRLFISNVFQSALKPHGPKRGHIYLKAAVSAYFPNLLETYNKLVILI